MNRDAKIYIAGHRGMVGSAIWRALEAEGYSNLIGKSSGELDLRNQQEVEDFFATEKPEYVFLAAARVGGIHANNVYRAEFLYDNLQIQNNIIHSAWKYGVTKLLFLGSSCIYPKMAPQPLKEEYLLTGLLEPTNEPYAIAKIAGIKLCESYRRQYGCNFISAMPTNLYGPNDNYDLNNSHVLPALIRKMHINSMIKTNNTTIRRRDINTMIRQYNDHCISTAKKIYIDPDFPNDVLFRAMTPYLHLFYTSTYSLDIAEKGSAMNNLKYQLARFHKISPTFGRKFIKMGFRKTNLLPLEYVFDIRYAQYVTLPFSKNYDICHTTIIEDNPEDEKESGMSFYPMLPQSTLIPHVDDNDDDDDEHDNINDDDDDDVDGGIVHPNNANHNDDDDADAETLSMLRDVDEDVIEDSDDVSDIVHESSTDEDSVHEDDLAIHMEIATSGSNTDYDSD